MKEYFQELDFNYQNELREIVKKQQNEVNKNALELSQIYYHKLKEYVKLNNFTSEADEINYFKNIKPKLQSQIIYFNKIIQIQSNIPIGCIETKKDYYSSHLKSMTGFYEDNRAVILYYRSFNTNLDCNFFIRKNACLHRDLEPEFAEVDFDQCTGYDLIIAKFMALEKLQHYIRLQIVNIDSLDPLTFLPGIYDNSAQSFVPEIEWSETKIALIEVLYVFKKAGAFCNGKIEMKSLVAHFEYLFKIDLGDHYKAVNEIKGRKNSKTRFLDQVIHKFKSKLDEEDSL